MSHQHGFSNLATKLEMWTWTTRLCIILVMFAIRYVWCFREHDLQNTAVAKLNGSSVDKPFWSMKKCGTVKLKTSDLIWIVYLLPTGESLCTFVCYSMPDTILQWYSAELEDTVVIHSLPVLQHKRTTHSLMSKVQILQRKLVKFTST